MSPSADTLAGLRDVRLPDGVTWLTDGLAGFALGLVAVVLLALLLGAFLRRAATRRELAWAELSRSRELAPGERLLGLARLAAEMAPDADADPGEAKRWDSLRAEIRAALYRPDAAPDLDDIDRRVGTLLARGRG